MPIRRLILTLLLTPAAAYAGPDRIVLPDTVVPTHYELSITPDAPNLRFTGSVRIDIVVKKPVRDIVLNAADLELKRAMLAGMKRDATINLDPERQTATLSFSSAVGAGRHVLRIDYAGKINQHAAGLFALDYDTPAGAKRALFTQFEDSDARRFLPCWDEPGIKATFSLNAIVPAAEMTLSNMPIAKTTQLKAGLARVAFAVTPPMSSYLLYFGVGDFERLSRRVDGIEVGIVVKRGDTDKARYALQSAAELLAYYDDYFGVKYALPKLDFIAGPGQSQIFSAMENWGAIYFFERALLVDPRVSTEYDRRNVYLTMAHEMAHMWFGDLVTMAWWDDLWLNEGFASWMQYKSTDRLHPEWRPWLDSLAAKEYAMAEDSLDGTHPIVTPINDVLQADAAFDNITYWKGLAVVRMLEDYVGADAFRAGVRAYIKAHAYGNAVTDDFWRALDQATRLPVSQIAHDFTLQAGVPLIRATAAPDGIHLTQERYAQDDSGKTLASWHVPVSVGVIGGAAAWHGIVSRESAADVPEAADAVPVVNHGQAGYYRSLYEPATFAKIALGFPQADPADQLGLLNDSLALGESGYEPMSDYLSLTRAATPGFNTTVLGIVVSQLDGLDFYFRRLPSEAAYQAYARQVLNPVLARIGWSPQPGEDQNVNVLRTSLILVLGKLGDPVVVAEARARFEAYLRDPSSLTSEQRRAVLRIVARHADAAIFEQLHALAKEASTNLDKREYYFIMGLAHDETLAKQALALSLTDEVPATTRPGMLTSVAIYYPELALDFYLAHQDAYDKLLEPAVRVSFVPSLAANAFDPSTITKLEAYAAAHIPAADQGNVVQAKANFNLTQKIRVERLPEMVAWITRQVAPAPP